jgi:hypothetical protein
LVQKKSRGGISAQDWPEYRLFFFSKEIEQERRTRPPDTSPDAKDNREHNNRKQPEYLTPGHDS